MPVKMVWERFRRRRLLRAMANFLQRMEQEGDIGKNGDPGFYLTRLSGEFREFLSLFTGVNCRSLTAEEFLELPLEYEASFLCGLFRNWDTLRFSGRGVDKIDLFQAIKAVENFIAALDKAEREKPLSREHPAAAQMVEQAAGSGTGGSE